MPERAFSFLYNSIMRCKYCNEYIEYIPDKSVYAVVCPKCFKVISTVSEYGFGDYVPMGFYMGYEKVAKLDYKNNKYALKRYQEDEDILIAEKFTEAYEEAKQIIENWLVGDGR